MAYRNETPIGLLALEQRLHQDLAWLALPTTGGAQKTHPAGRVQDVVIIGAGMAGMATALALRLAGIDAVLYDRARKDDEGPWTTTALMETLRSPKQLTGPALDLPSLTFRAWYEAQFGRQAWERLDKIPRLQWADYLRWYRRVLALDVRNEHELVNLLPRDDGVVQLDLRHAGQRQTVLARKVVLAVGMTAFGGAAIPDFVTALDRRYWAHAADPIDYSALNGRRVAVVGGSAAAMDTAATALEAGAGAVELLIRRADFPRVNKNKGAGSPGLEQGYYSLPDEWKWRLAHYIASEQIPPPRGSTLRVARHANAWFNFACPVLRAQQEENGVTLHTPKGAFPVDFVILATGYRLDWSQCPEYRALAGQIMLWRDAFRPPETQYNDQLAQYPYLNEDFSLRPKSSSAPQGLDRIHCFSYPAYLSNGYVVGLIPGLSVGARRLAQAIAAQLYVEDREYHYRRIVDYNEPELLGDEWRPAPPYSARRR
ncbi:NAD(P)/FAD-dependent oxidoreductase [Affinibrenneria salicis]|uniref:NAD(P)/FAD-dependent oxidoreductase n=1 Tax=Affinibrenneria salicis TaxID=2590031 RepID=A0A5J5G6G7_9GAMM|nr:NAD(P)/FAD-dependent oxidoreductase [Affinibrenneria salicis]KAA9002682.1 NAD(P)/FAD-dependent oxidoreductase [Affinibrenneria salicis]KAA9003031.1 NAD(P)/FAD-dependent oxidoreductase [Affinibrenneria salicis]